MWQDPIVTEVREIREAFAAKHHYNLREMCEALKKLEKKSKRPTVSFPPRRIEPTQAKKRAKTEVVASS